MLEYHDDEIRAAFLEENSNPVSDLEPFITRLYDNAYQDIYTMYKDRMSQSFLFQKEIFTKQISKIRNTNGQIYLKQSVKTLLNDQQPVFAFENMKLTDLIQQEFSFDVIETGLSAIKDSLFIDNVGNSASSIYLENSKVKLIGTNDEPNFINNIAPLGSTIFATFSTIESSNMGWI